MSRNFWNGTKGPLLSDVESHRQQWFRVGSFHLVTNEHSLCIVDPK